jgi:hypothetical protein
MAGVHINGHGTDEIAVVREKLTGKQRLFIFNSFVAHPFVQFGLFRDDALES